MKRFARVAAFVWIGISGPLRAALDLTPHEIAHGNGPAARRYYFQDDGKRLSFRLDNRMTISGGGGAVSINFADMPGAAMKMSRSSLNPSLLFDQKDLETYRAAAQALLPEGATEVQIEEVPDAVSINQWTSHQFFFTYSFFGLPCRRSITFINYNKEEQLILDVSAKDIDYAKAYTRSYQVLNSMTDFPVSDSGPT